MLRVLPDSILSVIFPQECTLCHSEVESSADGTVCSDCWNTTKIFSGNETLCMKCGAFLFAAPSPRLMACGKCEDHLYDRAIGVGVYEKALAASILRLKRTPHMPRRLKSLLSVAARNAGIDSASLVIPVPLSARRYRERGFNQAALIARFVAKELKLEVDEVTLVRRLHTPMHRAGMDQKARAVTVKKAFEVVRPQILHGRDVLLIDDIFTSGATASSCAKVLKESGVATVTVLTIAHAA